MKKNIRVVIADDSPVVLELLRAVFADTSEITIVGCASDGNMALKLTKELKPDLVTLDVYMPHMDGIELLEAIRKEKLIPDTPVIMLTNESDSDRIEKAKSLGIKGYIVKATKVPSEVVEEVLKITKL